MSRDMETLNNPGQSILAAATESWWAQATEAQKLFILHRVHAISWSLEFKNEFFEEVGSINWSIYPGWPLPAGGKTSPIPSQIPTIEILTTNTPKIPSNLPYSDIEGW